LVIAEIHGIPERRRRPLNGRVGHAIKAVTAAEQWNTDA
jgi:hypothetical protein